MKGKTLQRFRVIIVFMLVLSLLVPFAGSISAKAANQNYSLAGAEYGVFMTKADAEAGRNPIATFITDENGDTTPIKLEVGTYYIKELKASPGFELDPTIYEAVVTSEHTAIEPLVIVSLEEPYLDPIEINITKYDTDTGKTSPVKGAVFSVKYFDNENKEDINLDNPIGEWEITTNGQGRARFDSIYLNNGLITVVKMPEGTGQNGGFYLDKNYNLSFPIGWVVIEEKEFPEGYIDAAQTWEVVGNTASIDNNRSYIHIIDNDDENTTVVSLTKGNTPAKGTLVINKEDIYQKKPQGDVRDWTGTSFKLIYSSGLEANPNNIISYDGKEIEPALDRTVTDANVVSIKSTNADGEVRWENLPAGKYIIEEVGVNEGYTLSATVTKDGIIKHNEVRTNTVHNKPKDVTLEIIKKDLDNGEVLSGAKFRVYNESINSIWYKEVEYKKGDVIVEVITGDDGKALVEGLPRVATYKVEEVEAPKGYLLSNPASITKSGDAKTEKIEYEFNNPRKHFNVTVTKKDAILVTPQGNIKDFNGTSFKLMSANTSAIKYNGLMIGHHEFLKNADGTDLVLTVENGSTVTFANVPTGRYEVVEVNSANGMTLNTVPVEVKGENAADNSTMTVTKENTPELTTLIINKADSNGVRRTSMEATFEVKNASTNSIKFETAPYTVYGTIVSGFEVNKEYKAGDVIGTVKTDIEGKAIIDGLNKEATYSVTETVAPVGFRLPNEATITQAPTTIFAFEDEMMQLSIIIEKKDAELDNPQGNIKNFAGVEVTVYNENTYNIYYNGKTIVPHAAVGTFTIDESNKVTVSGLEYGKYSIKETKTIPGYLLNTETYNVDPTVDDEFVDNKVYNETVIPNDVDKYPFAIYKRDADTNGDNPGKIKLEATYKVYNYSLNAIMYGDKEIPGNPNKEYNDKYLIDTVTTKQGTDGKGGKIAIDLPNGTYLVEEISAPEGYSLVGKGEDGELLPITESGKSCQEITIVDEEAEAVFLNEIYRYSLVVEKGVTDTDSQKVLGDMSKIEGMEITIQTKQNIYVKEYIADGISYPAKRYAEGELITFKGATNIVLNNGKWESPINYLPYGEYIVTEVKAPKGFLLDSNPVPVNLKDNENGETVYISHKSGVYPADVEEGFISNHMERMTVKIFKFLTEGEKTDWTLAEMEGQAEQGAVFTIVPLKDLVERYGDKPNYTNTEVLATYEALKADPNRGPHTSKDNEGNTIILHEYDQIVTGDDGWASTAVNGLVKHAKYVIANTGARSPEIELLPYGKIFDGTTVEHEYEFRFYATNILKTYYLELTKKSSNDNNVTGINEGEVITLNSANFKITMIKDFEGKELNPPRELTQKIGRYYYNIFRTTSENSESQIVPVYYDPTTNPMGVASTPQKLVAGTYEITEIETPFGFITGDKVTIQISIGDEYISEILPDGEIVFKQDFYNEPAYGTINVFKSMKDLEGTLLVDAKTEIEKVEITLFANEDIYSPTTGELVHAKDDVVGKGNLSYNAETKQGEITFTKLSLGKDNTGAEYRIEETSIPASMKANTTVETRTVTYKDAETIEIVADPVRFTNEWTETELIKVRPDGTNFSGATLAIYEGNTKRHQFVSSTTSEKVLGLEKGVSYTLRELKTVEGYVLASDVKFELNNDDTLTKVTMINKKFELFKVDMAGKEVPGATITVYDKNNNVVDEWVSTDTPHAIKGLKVGETYTAKETATPNGYVKFTDWTFTVLDNGVDEYHEIIDKRVSLTKVDMAGEEVPGATITITNKDGEVVDTWVSTEETHYISGLEAGKTYTFTETAAPNGYVKATSFDFEVKDDGVDQHYDVIDMRVSITKVDIAGEEVPGATITITDKDGNVVDTWTSTEEPHYISGLTAGETYTFSETAAPNGYVKVTDFEFTVTDDGVDKHYDVVDIRVEVSKKNIMGEEVIGAKLQVIDRETKKVVDSWTSTNETHFVAGLVEGGKYTIVETAAPNGYVKMTSVDFDIVDGGATSPDKENMLIECVDKIVVVAKVDMNGEFVTGAKLQVVDDKNKVVDEWITSEEIHRVNGLEEGKTYTLKEVETPEGYVRASDITMEITLDKDTQTYMMIDKRVEVSKVDIGDKEVPGATITVYDEENNVIDTWVSTEETHFVSGLEVGKTYRFVEEAAPTGYVKMTDVPFTVTDDGIDQFIKLVDKVVVVSKVDMAGNPVKDAKLEVRDENDNVVDSWISNGELHKVSGLEEGKNYTLIEVEAPKGYVRASNIAMEITLDKATQTYTMTDKRVEIFKSDIGGNEVVGAELTVYDENGKLVDTWISTDKPHAISNLEVGKTYTLHEVAAPNGFVKITDWTFTVTDDGVDEFHRVEDIRVIVNKLDEGNNFVANATFEVRDKNGELVDTFTTDGKPYAISNLQEGETYTIYETVIPTGYVGIGVDGIEFTVDSYKEINGKSNMIIDILNVQFSVYKTDVSGEEVEGAELTVYDEKGNVVDTWVSGTEPHPISGLRQGQSYVLREVAAPNGFVKITEWEFEITPDFKVSEKHDIIDKRVAILKVDANNSHLAGAILAVYDEEGNEVDKWTSTEEAHYVSNLEEGKVYTMKELEAPIGYVKAADVVFTVTYEKVDQDYSLINKQFKIYKTDISGEEVEGALLVVYIAETGEMVDSWISTDEPHAIRNLEIGKKYILEEEAAPNGFVKISKWEFTVTDDGVDEVHYIEDMRVIVNKVDTKGTAIPGAMFEIRDEDDNVVDSWTSTTDPYAVSGLEEGKAYTLIEVKAPEGYIKANPINFIVKNMGEDMVIDVLNTQFSVSKVDVSGEEIEGATLTVYDENGEVVDTWVSGKEPHPISNLERGHSYKLIEEAAPNGYVKITEWNFTITNEGTVDELHYIEDIRVAIKKVDQNGEPVIGAKLGVISAENVVLALTVNEIIAVIDYVNIEDYLLDSWTTTEEVHYVSNLEEGKSYYLVELETPEGYATARPVKFNTNNEHEDIEVTMINPQVFVEKLDSEGKPLAGAKITVYSCDDCCNEVVVDTWISDGTPHAIKNLVVGKSYRIVEEEAPEGYVRSDKVQKFTVNAEKNDTIVFENTRVLVEKTDVEGNPVIGAKFEVYGCDDCCNEVLVDEWVSDGTVHAIKNLVMGKKYTLKEIAPDGYVSIKPITFTVSEEEQTITVVNTRVSVDKLDKDGNRVIGAIFVVYDKDGKEVDRFTTGEEVYYISNLVEGEEYNLEEIFAPAGLYRMPELKAFTSEHGVDFTMSITDDPIEYRVHKVDENGKFIKGAKLQLIDKETEEVIFEWVAEKEEFDISKYLVDGRTYILHEVEAPFGYELAEDIEFTVEWADKEVVVAMTDIAKTLFVRVAKADKDDIKFFLKGAEITVYDEEGNIVLDIDGKECIGLTDENGEVSFRIAYDQDKKYFAKETKAPEGYTLNEELFEVVASEDYGFMETDLIRISILDAAIIIPPVEIPTEPPYNPPTTPPDTGDHSVSPLVWGALFGTAGIGAGTVYLVSKKKREEEN